MTAYCSFSPSIVGVSFLAIDPRHSSTIYVGTRHGIGKRSKYEFRRHTPHHLSTFKWPWHHFLMACDKGFLTSTLSAEYSLKRIASNLWF
jgi:hypothetical protein